MTNPEEVRANNSEDGFYGKSLNDVTDKIKSMTTEKAARAIPEWAEKVRTLYHPCDCGENICTKRLIEPSELEETTESLLTTREAEVRQEVLDEIVRFAPKILEEMYTAVDTHKRIRSEGTKERVKILLCAMWYQLCNKLTTNPKETTCEHDFPRAIRKGRASYECPTCHEDISMAWFYWMDAIKD